MSTLWRQIIGALGSPRHGGGWAVCQVVGGQVVGGELFT